MICLNYTKGGMSVSTISTHHKEKKVKCRRVDCLNLKGKLDLTMFIIWHWSNAVVKFKNDIIYFTFPHLIYDDTNELTHEVPTIVFFIFFV